MATLKDDFFHNGMMIFIIKDIDFIVMYSGTCGRSACFCGQIGDIQCHLLPLKVKMREIKKLFDFKRLNSFACARKKQKKTHFANIRYKKKKN